MRGWYVISLRPLGEHGGVRRSARRCGAVVFALSTVRLQPLEAGATLREALRCPRIVVSSPAAARFAGAQLDLVARKGQRWYAQGPGTAAALRRCGIADVRTPAAGFDSEALLRDPELARVRGESVGLITAPGGRGLLAASLRQRGAHVLRAEVYCRQPMPLAAARLRALAALPVRSALLLSSSEALAVLWQALDGPGRAQLTARPCVVASARLAAQARALGFAHVLQADGVQPASLLKALSDHADGPGFR
ncbi:MAG: uroporphyrinogen-III synthase [Arenimonas sp.]